jgi:hypothetical protein
MLHKPRSFLLQRFKLLLMGQPNVASPGFLPQGRTELVLPTLATLVGST